MFGKLFTLWLDLGIKVIGGYVIFVEKIGPASIIVTPFMLLGFSIPWLLVTMLLLGIDILYGRIVLDLTIKEQIEWLKEGFNEGYHGTKNG